MTLQELRDQLDLVDKGIVELYEKRMDLCAQVAENKKGTGKAVYDKEREEAKLNTVAGLTHNEFNKKGIRELFEQLMSVSRKLQYSMLDTEAVDGLTLQRVEDFKTPGTRVVFQGAEGAYSQMAMVEYFGADIENFHVESFRDAMEAIKQGKADFAVLPIENSTAGTVNEIFDLLQEYDNYIVGEQVIRIEHCLLGVPGAKLQDITTVYSHPQSLMQSAAFLGQQDWQLIPMLNNAFAAEKVAKTGDAKLAAIASAYAGEIYGLEVLKRGVNQCNTNATKFIIVTNQKICKRGADKISICFELPHESGSLYHVLSHFIYNDLNMTNIQSRPMAEKDWEYRFFVEFQGNLKDSAVQNALRGIKEETGNMKVLGNY